jgi:hypothetical protein
MTDAEVHELYGWAEIDPSEPVIAGSTGTWNITYHAGKYGIDDGGVLKIAWRDVSDWQAPQFADPSAPAYATVTTSGPATLRPAFEKQRYVRPWRLCVTIDVFDESLSEGDTVTLTIGDTSGGSPGSRAQTFCKELFEFRVAVDWCGTWVYEEVPSPRFPIVSGPPAKLVAITASETTPGEPTWVGIKAEDIWGNPCTSYDGMVTIENAGLIGLPETYQFEPDDSGVHRFEGVQATEVGVFRVSATDTANELTAESNGLKCIDSRSSHQPFWGDLHGQSEETVGTNPVSSYFRFAREAALVDFAGHQGNDFQITEEVWTEIKHQANTQNDPGNFVAFVGYEWSGNTPVGGDHNVYYPGEDGPIYRSSHVLISDKSDVDTDCLHVTDLYETLKGKDALLVPHVGGRYANLNWHDPNLEYVVEVYSEWGEFEWFLKWALEQSYRVGFTAGSDDHKGRPGAAYPGSGSFGVYGGLTCIYAKELSREGLWEAIKSRRCYGTSGQRILLDVRANGQPMGSDLNSTSPPKLTVDVTGTASIERVDVFRGLECVYTYPETISRAENQVRIAWSGQRIRARNRLVRWDGGLSIRNGKILNARGYAFDSASEGIQESSSDSVTWKSVTTGDADGVILDIEGSPETAIDFDTEIVNTSLTLGDLEKGPIKVEAGGIEIAVVFEYVPVGVGREVSFEFTESELPTGCHPYWVRVTQVDGAKAWSSPIYTTV